MSGDKQSEIATKAFWTYDDKVLKGWDGTSVWLEDETQAANRKIQDTLGITVNPENREIQIWSYVLELQTDWVGTKIQIYMELFEGHFKEYKKWDISYEDLKIYAEKIADWMIADLSAMMYDDWIDWKRALAFTNIIDTNDTSSERAIIFYKAFTKSLGKSIIKNKVFLSGWETADLWENGKFIKALDRYKESSDKWRVVIKKLHEQIMRAKKLDGSEEIVASLKEIVKTIVLEWKDIDEFLSDLTDQLELNLAWTTLLIKESGEELEKMREMEEGDIIMTFSENLDSNKIISPRSNGLTLVRTLWKEILWTDWANKTFEDFLAKIGPEKEKLLPKKFKEKLKGLKMWYIASWETTTFNEVIADKMLWWINWAPLIEMSWNIHWTWNPIAKLFKNGLKGNKNLKFNMNVKDLVIPDIFQLFQVAYGIDDITAAKSWNMWMPNHIIVKPWYEEEAKKIAEENWYTLNATWKVEERKENEPAIIISWVWIGNSTIATYDGEKLIKLDT